MNEVALKGIFKIAKNLISPAQIKEAATGLIQSAINFKNELPLNADTGEVAVTGMIWEIAGVVYCGLAVLNCENHIVRFENVQPLDTIIDNLINKL